MIATLVGLPAAAGNGPGSADMEGTRASAMGGALRASASGPSAVLMNPAGMSLARQYVINGTYLYRASDRASLVNASIVDSVTTRLAAGIFYSFAHARPELTLRSATPVAVSETQTTHEAGLALSYPLGQAFLLGVTTRYINHSSELGEGTPDSVPVSDFSAVTVDVGGILRLTPSLALAAVGYNLVPVDDKRAYPLSLGLGVGYQAGSLMLLEFDSVIDFTSDPDAIHASFHGGAEIFVDKRYSIRGGAMHDMHRNATYVTGGLGLLLARLSLEASLRQMVDGGAETMLAFSLGLFLQ